MGRGMVAKRKKQDAAKIKRKRKEKELNDLVEETKRILTPEVDKTLCNMKNAAYTSAIIAARDCFGFGKQRLIRFAARMDECYDEMGEAGEDWERFFDEVLNETGMKETDFVREDLREA